LIGYEHRFLFDPKTRTPLCDVESSAPIAKYRSKKKPGAGKKKEKKTGKRMTRGAVSAASYEEMKATFEASRFRTTGGGKRRFHRTLDGTGSLVSESEAAFVVSNEDWAGGCKSFLRG
jgi:hypothetical protein